MGASAWNNYNVMALKYIKKHYNVFLFNVFEKYLFLII